MKFYVAFVLFFAGVALAQDALQDGQPGCTKAVELKIQNFRNKSDPTKYWVCEELGKPATLASCPAGTVFVYGRPKCVKPSILNWGLPVPPNLSDKFDRSQRVQEASSSLV